jgi:hypothetical protein
MTVSRASLSLDIANRQNSLLFSPASLLSSAKALRITYGHSTLPPNYHIRSFRTSKTTSRSRISSKPTTAPARTRRWLPMYSRGCPTTSYRSRTPRLGQGSWKVQKQPRASEKHWRKLPASASRRCSIRVWMRASVRLWRKRGST